LPSSTSAAEAVQTLLGKARSTHLLGLLAASHFIEWLMPVPVCGHLVTSVGDRRDDRRGQRKATTRTPQPTEELTQVDAKLPQVVAPGPSIRERAETVQPIGRAVAAHLRTSPSSGDSGGVTTLAIQTGADLPVAAAGAEDGDGLGGVRVELESPWASVTGLVATLYLVTLARNRAAWLALRKETSPDSNSGPVPVVLARYTRRWKQRPQRG
jgi:hypothetical protein